MAKLEKRGEVASPHERSIAGGSEVATDGTLDGAIRQLLRGGAAFVGHDFFPAVVRDLAQVLHADFVFVGRLTGDRASVETVALWANGQIQENFTYSLTNTPCANVVGQGVCVHPRDVAAEFPKDQLLSEMDVDGYVGVPLYDVGGGSLGIIVALYRGAVPDPDFASTIMMVFAARTAAEMERVIQEEAQRSLETKFLQAQKLESLGVLAGGIAHDFNNLLMSMMGSMDLAALELPESHPAMEHLRFTAKTAHQAGELCRQLLAYAGKGSFELHYVDISSVVSDSEQLLRTSASRCAALEFALTPGLPAARLDLAQLSQVLLNLVVNASEAIGETSGTILIATGRVRVDEEYLAANDLLCSPDPGDYVFVEVSDTGHGMSPEVMKSIFDPFYTTKFTGRGLGLAAILGIVQGHRGAIEISSEPGQGTSFRILFPVSEEPAEARKQRPAGPWRGDGLALVIDDDPGVLHVGSQLLRSLGFDVLVAGDGVEGLELFREHADLVRVVLLDLTMPNMGGDAVHRELRELRPELPIILMSGFSQQDTGAQFADDRLSGFLQKPFRLEDVRQMVRVVIEGGQGC